MRTPGKIHFRNENIYAVCMIVTLFCIGQSFHNRALPAKLHTASSTVSSQCLTTAPPSSNAPLKDASSISSSQPVQSSQAQPKKKEPEKKAESKPQKATEQIQTSRYYDVPLSTEMQDTIFTECKIKNVPEDLVIALIGVESHYNPKCISKTNDYGLMQINICHKESLERNLQVTDLLDSKQNIKAGVYMLSWIVNKYSNVNQALMVYNSGESGAQKLWKQGIYSTSYSRKVIAQMDKIKIET